MADLLIRRVDEPLHRLIRIAAAARGLSITAWGLAAFRAEILRQAREPGGVALASALDEKGEGQHG